jgi:hypothetical protein
LRDGHSEAGTVGLYHITQAQRSVQRKRVECGLGCAKACSHYVTRAAVVLCTQELFPQAEYYKRQGYPLKKICQYAANRDYTDVLVFNEDHKQVSRVCV